MTAFTPREELVEIVNKLFVYTDEQQWEKLQTEIFSEKVALDMSSLNGPNQTFTAVEICNMWADGFKGIDAVNHLGGNYLVHFLNDTAASVYAYATATHYKQNASKGQTREFVGTYDLKLKKEENGWRIHAFKYQLKYMSGNAALE